MTGYGASGRGSIWDIQQPCMRCVCCGSVWKAITSLIALSQSIESLAKSCLWRESRLTQLAARAGVLCRRRRVAESTFP